MLFIGYLFYFTHSICHTHSGHGTKKMRFPANLIIRRKDTINESSINDQNDDGNDDRFEVSSEYPEEYQKGSQCINQSTGANVVKGSPKDPNQYIGEKIGLQKHLRSYSVIEYVDGRTQKYYRKGIGNEMCQPTMY